MTCCQSRRSRVHAGLFLVGFLFVGGIAIAALEVFYFHVAPFGLGENLRHLHQSKTSLSVVYNKMSAGVLVDTVPFDKRLDFYSRVQAAGVKRLETVTDSLNSGLRRWEFDQGVLSVELEYCLETLRQDTDKTLLTLFTTMHPSDHPLKQLAQQNVLESYAYLSKFGVKSLLFTDNAEWRKRAEILNIQVISEQAANQFGTPFLHDMYLQAMEASDSYYYAYSNGDILFTTDLISSLCSIRSSIVSQNGGLDQNSRVLIVGKRSNYQMNITDVLNAAFTPEQYYAMTTRFYESSALFQSNAQDYFIVTRSTFDWNTMPQYVIGRIAYDNCLVRQAIDDQNIYTIDATHTIHAIHLTDSGGNYAGHTQKNDSYWNKNRCKGGWYLGETDKCEYYTNWEKVKVVLDEHSPAIKGEYIEHPDEKQNLLARSKQAQNAHVKDLLAIQPKMLEVAIRQRHFYAENYHKDLKKEHAQHALLVKNVGRLLTLVVVLLILIFIVVPNCTTLIRWKKKQDDNKKMNLPYEHSPWPIEHLWYWCQQYLRV